jgi:hypothetical protein
MLNARALRWRASRAAHARKRGCNAVDSNGFTKLKKFCGERLFGTVFGRLAVQNVRIAPTDSRRRHRRRPRATPRGCPPSEIFGLDLVDAAQFAENFFGAATMRVALKRRDAS